MRRTTAGRRRALSGGVLVLGLGVQPVAARAACSLTTFSDKNGSPGILVKGDALPQSVYLEDSQTSVLVRIDCNNNGSFGDPGDATETATTWTPRWATGRPNTSSTPRAPSSTRTSSSRATTPS